ncbi:MAG: ATP-binding protein [Chlorobi bacterium]|nr:ATP-binding protein [Chlorobiota bacterium]
MALIIITGPPCTGKTSLSGMISGRYSIPAFGKDRIKEPLADLLNNGGDIPSQRLGIAAEELLYVVAEELMRAGSTVILEGTFRDRYARVPISGLAGRHAAEVIQIQCVADPEILLSRYRARDGRHPIHPALDGAAEFERDMRRGRYEPIDIPGIIITHDTTDFAAVDYSVVYDAVERVLR